MAESLAKGNRVVVNGRLKSRTFETREGEKRTVFELDVDEIGPSLRYATAKVTRTQRSGGGGGNFGGGGGFGGNAGGGFGQSSPQADPWGAPAGGSGGWGNGDQSDPPF